MDSQWKTPQAYQSWGVLSFWSTACGACASLCFMLCSSVSISQSRTSSILGSSWRRGYHLHSFTQQPLGGCSAGNLTLALITRSQWLSGTLRGASLSVLHLSCLQSHGHIHTLHLCCYLDLEAINSWLTLGGCFLL